MCHTVTEPGYNLCPAAVAPGAAGGCARVVSPLLLSLLLTGP